MARSKKPRAKGETPIDLQSLDEVTALEALRSEGALLLEITDCHRYERLVGSLSGYSDTGAYPTKH